MHKFDDETLMAFADGELDEETRQAVEKALDSDEDLAQRVSVFRQTATLSKQALEPILHQPVPEALRASITKMMEETAEPVTEAAEPANETVVPFKPPPAKAPPRRVTSWIAPLAASITLIVGGLAGYLVGQQTGSEDTGGLTAARFDQPGLTQALQTVASGQEITLDSTGDRLRVIASYLDADDGLCREFEIDQPDRTTFVSVACHAGSSWNVQFTVAAASQSDSGYAPASSLEALDAYLQAVGAGEVLSEEAEQQALNRL